VVIAILGINACGWFPSQQLSLSSLNFNGKAKFLVPSFWSAAGPHVLATIFGMAVLLLFLLLIPSTCPANETFFVNIYLLFTPVVALASSVLLLTLLSTKN